MRLTRTLCLFFFALIIVHLNAQSFEGYPENKPDETNWNVQISNEVRLWPDSLHYRFLVVRFTGIPIHVGSIDFAFDMYYKEFNGPVFLRDDLYCTIYPMYSNVVETDTVNLEKTIEAYFCTADLFLLKDTFTVYCEGYSGYVDQSQINIMHLTKEVQRDLKWFLVDEDKSYPVATEKWFQKWRRENWGMDRNHIWYLDNRHRCI